MTMYEHSDELAQYPWPYHLLPVATEPLESLDAVDILKALLEQTVGLAGALYAASLHDEMAQHELSAALQVLAEHTRSTLGVWRRWQQGNSATQ
jgi:hypothetical protein